MMKEKSTKSRKDVWGKYSLTFVIGWIMASIGFNFFLQPVPQPVSKANIVLIILLLLGIVVIIYSTYKAEMAYRKIRQHN